MEENTNNQEMYGDNSSNAGIAQASEKERGFQVPSTAALISVIEGNGKISKDHYLIGVCHKVASRIKELKKDYVEFIKDSEGFSYFVIYGSESNENGKTISYSPNDNLFRLTLTEHIALGAGPRARFVEGSKLSLEDEVLSA